MIQLFNGNYLSLLLQRDHLNWNGGEVIWRVLFLTLVKTVASDVGAKME